jgi:hypothetical protein
MAPGTADPGILYGIEHLLRRRIRRVDTRHRRAARLGRVARLIGQGEVDRGQLVADQADDDGDLNPGAAPATGAASARLATRHAASVTRTR